MMKVIQSEVLEQKELSEFLGVSLYQNSKPCFFHPGLSADLANNLQNDSENFYKLSLNFKNSVRVSLQE